jgi:type IV secretory pathway ATPase VirB11/archaellum biosynthesis ATPase
LLTVQDLVENRSTTEEGAAVLRAIASSGRSFLVYALPQNAGKSTLTHAILAEAPSDLSQHDFLGTEKELRSLTDAPARGYVTVGEIGHRGRPGYLTGEEVVRAFELIEQGYALASSLHADSPDHVFEVLGRNGITPDVAAGVTYLVKVRVLGDPHAPDTRRVVEEIYEVVGADENGPVTSLLYRWDGE